MASSAELSAYENYPLSPPPPGQTSNFENPESRGPAIVVLCCVFMGIMWPIFILRLYSKVWVIRRFGWDDGKPAALPAIYLLTYYDSLCHHCCGLYRFLQSADGSNSDFYQASATAFAAGVIWSVDDNFFGRHEWDVRAVMLTPHTVKVSTHRK